MFEEPWLSSRSWLSKEERKRMKKKDEGNDTSLGRSSGTDRGELVRVRSSRYRSTGIYPIKVKLQGANTGGGR